jgi:hypothetical protein
MPSNRELEQKLRDAQRRIAELEGRIRVLYVTVKAKTDRSFGSKFRYGTVESTARSKLKKGEQLFRCDFDNCILERLLPLTPARAGKEKSHEEPKS